MSLHNKNHQQDLICPLSSRQGAYQILLVVLLYSQKCRFYHALIFFGRYRISETLYTVINASGSLELI